MASKLFGFVYVCVCNFDDNVHKEIQHGAKKVRPFHSGLLFHYVLFDRVSINKRHFVWDPPASPNNRPRAPQSEYKRRLGH